MPRIGLPVYNEPRICACKIEFDMQGGALLAANVVQACAFHAPFFAVNGHLATVQRILNQGARWQRFCNEGLPAEIPACGFTTDDGTRILKRDSVDWAWNGDVLEITLHVQPTQQQLTRIQNFINANNLNVTVTVG